MTKRTALELLLLVGVLLLASGFGAADLTDLQITETASPAQESVRKFPAGNITWTMVVTNNGPLADTNVQVSDPLPNGNDYVGATATPTGTCAGGATLGCNLGTIAAGDSVTITLVTTPTQEGHFTNTPTVSGDLEETTLANNAATATAQVVGCFGCGGPRGCAAVYARPKQLHAGRSTTMHFKVVYGRRALRGMRLRITGPGIHITTKPSNAKGAIDKTLRPEKSGIVYIKPTAQAKVCKVARVGITGGSTPPVTG